MENFPEINKRVVPNKHVGRKLWKVNECQLESNFILDCKIQYFLVFIIVLTRNKPIKTVKNTNFLLSVYIDTNKQTC